MRTLLLRSAVVLILIVAAIAGHLVRLVFGFEAGFIVFFLVFFGAPAAIPISAIVQSESGFLNIGAPERRWLASAAEVYAFWRAFVVLMPFDTFWMGDEKVLPHAPDETPIVLIPGYCSTRGLWFDVARELEAAGRKVAPITLGWTFADIDELADELDQHIARVKQQTGAEKVLLVGHSKGGLVARARIARRGGDDVAGLITLCTPHHGTSFAKYGFGRSARQMEPDSPWLQALNAKETSVRVHAFWAGRDEFVSPPDSARLQGAPETCAPLAGHMSVIDQPEVLKKILAFSEPAAKRAPSAALNPQPEPPAPVVVVAPVEAAPAVAEKPTVVVAPVAEVLAEEPAPSAALAPVEAATSPVEKPTVVVAPVAKVLAEEPASSVASAPVEAAPSPAKKPTIVVAPVAKVLAEEPAPSAAPAPVAAAPAAPVAAAPDEAAEPAPGVAPVAARPDPAPDQPVSGA